MSSHILVLNLLSMAYVVSIDDGRETENYYYRYKSAALDRFNDILKQLNLFNLNGDKVPCQVETRDWWRVRIKQIDWSDVASQKFIFVDNEDNFVLVLGDCATFEAEYVKLTKKYRDKDLDWSGFYDELEQKLKWKGVDIVPDIQIVNHDNLFRS